MPISILKLCAKHFPMLGMLGNTMVCKLFVLESFFLFLKLWKISKIE
jgi:hypothetical protein